MAKQKEPKIKKTALEPDVHTALLNYCNKHNKIMRKEASRFVKEGLERESKKKP